MNGFIIEATVTFCAELFTQPPSSFSLRSCARRNLIYFTGTQSANFPRASPILCLVFEKVLALVYHDPYTYTKFVVAQALLLRKDARAYFVGSGPRHYFEIHEVEWRNRVRVKFGIGRGKETAEGWRSGPVEVTFVEYERRREGDGTRREEKKAPRRQTHLLFCMRRRKVHRRYLNIRSIPELNIIGRNHFYIDNERKIAVFPAGVLRQIIRCEFHCFKSKFMR